MPAAGVWLGRVCDPRHPHPTVVTLRDEEVIDITAPEAPTVRDICEREAPAEYVLAAAGRPLGPLRTIMDNSFAASRDPTRPSLLSPVDLQSIKAAGVTFVASLLERVIEEQARGVPAQAAAIRAEIEQWVGTELSNLKPGSAQAATLKAKLIARGAWSPYLEVGIGPDAEIFTKCPPLASVGFGADIGVLPGSEWNNPEPEMVVIASSRARIVGATLGNDVNLRDVEGRSALLLGRAKDNNASAALGPFIRLFHEGFGLGEVQRATVRLEVHGSDGFHLAGASSMARISRSPEALIAAAMGAHHQYPDGIALYLGTMFVPSQDRGEPGRGFTHRIGDQVTIWTESLGALVNRVRFTSDCPPWTYGVSHLMRDLARAQLL
jgi:fumarylacetoacetate (FAA) hydrolase family protein